MNTALNPTHRQSALKLPPYGKRFDVDAKETVFVFAGGQQAWGRAKREYQLGLNRALVLPENSSPTDMRWPVSGRDVITIDYGANLNEPLYEALSLTLLRQGVAGVIVIHQRTNKTYRFERG